MLRDDFLEPEDLDPPLDDDLLTLRPLDERETDLPDDFDAPPDDLDLVEDRLVFPEDLAGRDEDLPAFPDDPDPARPEDRCVLPLDRDTPLDDDLLDRSEVARERFDRWPEASL